MPRDYDEAIRALDQFQQGPADTYCDGQAKQVIENCRVLEADGKCSIRIRDDVGADIKPKNPINMVVFSVNCDPDLFEDQPGRPTVGKFELERVNKLLAEYPKIGGIYVDSAAGWVSRTRNFRRDHFAYTDYPLTYADPTGRANRVYAQAS